MSRVAILDLSLVMFQVEMPLFRCFPVIDEIVVLPGRRSTRRHDMRQIDRYPVAFTVRLHRRELIRESGTNVFRQVMFTWPRVHVVGGKGT